MTDKFYLFRGDVWLVGGHRPPFFYWCGMQVKSESRHQIHKLLEVLSGPNTHVYIGVKKRCYIPIYLARYFKKIGYEFEWTATYVKARNYDHLESPRVYEVYRIT